MSSDVKLFFVKFKMNDFTDAQGKAWDGVPVTLLIDEDNREPLVAYEVGIKDYDKNPMKEHALRSLFGEDEAQKLVEYLKEHEGYEAEAEEVELPIEPQWPWYAEIDPAKQGFIGVSKLMCEHIGLRLVAYFDLREDAVPK